MEKVTVEDLMEKLRSFAEERDWDKFHSPKNLSMAVAAEAGELLEEFMWLTEDESKRLGPEHKQRVRDEVGDVLICLLNVCLRCEIDPLQAASDKLAKNKLKYPVEKSKGHA